MKIIILLTCLIFTALANSNSEALPNVPEGFEKQILDVTYGHIAKPKGWFYYWGTDKNSIIWTISKEDTKKGSYLTGMRIQFVPGMFRRTKKTPQEFAESFINDKKNSAKVLLECKQKEIEDFTRQCIETIENIRTTKGEIKFHILYSVMWSKAKDAIVLTTFGAPVEDWEQVRPIIDVMADFELIGEEFWKQKNP
jgi:hypothetical protein